MEHATEMTSANVIVGFIFAIISAFVCAHYAEKKGRNSLGWFILGLLFTIFSLIVLYFLESLKKENASSEGSQLEKSDVLTAPSPVSLEHVPFENTLKEEEVLWFYLDADHEQMGPVSLVALRELWNRGLLDLKAYVWTEGMEKWERVENLPGLLTALNKGAIF